MGGTDCNSKKKEKKKKRPKFDEKYPRKSLPASPSTERVSDSTLSGYGEGGNGGDGDNGGEGGNGGDGDDSDGRDSRVGDGEIVVIGCDGGFW